MPRSNATAVALRELARVLAEPPGRQPDGAPVIIDGVVLTALKRLIPSDLVTFNDLAPHRRDSWANIGDSEFDLDVDEDEDDGEIDFFDQYWTSPCSYAERTGDWESVTTIGDFLTLREWRNSLMYALGQPDREMILPLPSPPGHSRRVRWLRARGRDFDDTDRALAGFVRPHLVAYLHTRELASRSVPPLTPRQRQLLMVVASGRTNVQAARSLGITAATVRTHLQLIYSRLGVASRSEAVALVFPSAAWAESNRTEGTG